MNEADWWAGTEGERKSGNGAGGRNGAPPASFCGGRVVESRFSGKTGVALSLRGTLFGPLRLRAARLVRAMSIDRSGGPTSLRSGEIISMRKIPLKNGKAGFQRRITGSYV